MVVPYYSAERVDRTGFGKLHDALDARDLLPVRVLGAVRLIDSGTVTSAMSKETTSSSVASESQSLAKGHVQLGERSAQG